MSPKQSGIHRLAVIPRAGRKSVFPAASQKERQAAGWEGETCPSCGAHEAGVRSGQRGRWVGFSRNHTRAARAGWDWQRSHERERSGRQGLLVRSELALRVAFWREALAGLLAVRVAAKARWPPAWQSGSYSRPPTPEKQSQAAGRVGGRGLPLERRTRGQGALALTRQALLQTRWPPRRAIQTQVPLDSVSWLDSWRPCWNMCHWQRTLAVFAPPERLPHPPAPLAAKAHWRLLEQLGRYSRPPARASASARWALAYGRRRRCGPPPLSTGGRERD